MKVSPETLQKMAHLARLQLSPDKEAHMLASLNDIVAWMDKLAEVDTTGVLPLTHLTQEVNHTRPDALRPALPHQQALAPAPQHDADFFRVPKVVHTE